jgi:ATP-dependent DNA helicase RecQ
VEPEKASSRREQPNHQAAQIECHEGLFEHLRILRKEVADASKVPPYVVFSDRSLRAIAAHMPENEREFLCLHGIGEKKFQNYGIPFLHALHDFLKKHPEVKSEKQAIPPSSPTRATTIKRGISTTVLDTYQLIQEGLSLEEITKRRGFANSTIETHIAKLIEEGKQIDQHQFVTEEQFQLCTELFAEHGDEALSPVIEAANGKLDYGHAKIVRAIMSLDQD